MTDKEALECVRDEIIKYKEELKQNIFDEIVGSGVIFGSTLSSAYFISVITDENKFKALPYAVAVLISSLISLKNHDRYARSEDEKNGLKELKKLKRKIINGSNPLENIEKEDFNKYLILTIK